MLSGSWDILLKIRVKNAEEVGNFVINKIRKIHGIDKTVTSIVFNDYEGT